MTASARAALLRAMPGAGRTARGMVRAFAAAASLLAALGALPAAAQPYPSRPIKLLANGNPGGVIDTMARVTAASLGSVLGVQVVVENKPGASGIIGTQAVVTAPSDGYTLLFTGVDGMDILPVTSKLPYDPDRDLIPIARLTQVDVVLAVGAHVPANSVQEFVALARARPGALAFASTGTGAMTHLAGELLKLRAGIDLLHVPYRGSGPAVADLLGGRVDLVFTGVATAVGHVQNGAMKVLASAGEHRPSMMPQVPTMIESGYPDFLSGSWFGVLAPAGTPPDIVRLLAGKLAEAADTPGFAAQLAKLGSEKAVLLTDDFGGFIKAERKLWRGIAEQANIRPAE